MNRNEFAIVKGYTLNREEQITREVIESLMCNYRIDWNELAGRLHLSADEVKGATAYDEDTLSGFAADGLIEFDERQLAMTVSGSPFVRNVAASLDRLMLHSTRSFSKPI